MTTSKRRIGFGLWALVALLGATAWAGGEVGESATMTHRMMMLMIQLGVILFAARLAGLLFERLKLPSVIGELCAGIVIGPHLLGAVSLPGFAGGLFPPTGFDFPLSPELYGICAFASVVLLFMVGLETDIRLFMRYSLAGSMVGIGGVVFSFLVGDGLGILFSRMLFDHPLGFLSPSCIFLGIISTATSVGITARVLSERRKLDSPEGVTILAGAVIDDVLGILLLAVGLGVITASKASGRIDWGHIGIIAAKSVGIWLAATVIGLTGARRIGGLLKRFKSRSTIAVLALGLALVLAGLFEEAGLAMIIGAYVMGLSLSRTDLNYVIREKLSPVFDLLVPVFFAAMGMLVDVHVLGSREVLVFGAVYTVGAVIAKVGGCGLAALMGPFNLRGALRVGVGMMPRGEVALIIAGIGLASGLLPAKIFGVSVLMTLVTTVVAPPLLVALFRSPARGVRRARVEDVVKPVVFAFPSAETVDLVVAKLEAVFESEGFFMHVLNRQEGLYQLRKDQIVIGFRHEDNAVVFECDKGDVPFVSTAMFEVLAELEQTIKELRKPIDFDCIGRMVQESGDLGGSRAILSRFMDSRALVLRLKGTTKEDVINELLDVLVKVGSLRDADVAAARDAVWRREQSISTGMQHGMAIPHGRTDTVRQLVCAVGLKPDGLNFDSIDGELSRIVVLTLSPKSVAAPHVQFMSTVTQMLSEDGRQALLACETTDEMNGVLTGRVRPREFLAEKQKRIEAVSRPQDSVHARLAAYLKPDLLAVNVGVMGKAEVIDVLLGMLQRAGEVRDIDAARAAILEREEQLATGLGHGVAIPHARTDAVDKLVCAIAVTREGIDDFSGPDGEAVRIVVLTLTPTEAATPHVQFMATISRILDEQGRARVLAARTTDELWRALTRSTAPGVPGQ